ncbi:hypothetical protein PsorP6_000915 [Peronosclerospora sorghi]|uniref:Uncharacterized protein n=1 Tax=Peronosclerospora sorghi TaxID=230839 RepID=A0ACC0WWD2_9STRA|nr:hypothetical protein PsorP6_000915 [Peronosclerospora sorghi]
MAELPVRDNPMLGSPVKESRHWQIAHPLKSLPKAASVDDVAAATTAAASAACAMFDPKSLKSQWSIHDVKFTFAYLILDHVVSSPYNMQRCQILSTDEKLSRGDLLRPSATYTYLTPDLWEQHAFGPSPTRNTRTFWQRLRLKSKSMSSKGREAAVHSVVNSLNDPKECKVYKVITRGRKAWTSSATMQRCRPHFVLMVAREKRRGDATVRRCRPYAAVIQRKLVALFS